MSGPSTGKWTLDQDAFSGLLSTLDEDRQRAGRLYEELRRKLIRFFDWEGCLSPEDKADETINRLAKRISDGVEVQSVDGFLFGAARFVLLESFKKQRRDEKVVHLLQATSTVNQFQDPFASERTLYLRLCLKEVSPESRRLILSYYRGEGRKRIENRKLLARELQIPLNTLRNRALRVRERLEKCVRGHLAPAED